MVTDEKQNTDLDSFKLLLSKSIGFQVVECFLQQVFVDSVFHQVFSIDVNDWDVVLVFLKPRFVGRLIYVALLIHKLQTHTGHNMIAIPKVY